MKLQRRMISGLEYVFLLFIIIISLVPLLWVLITSFKTNFEIHQSALALPKQFNFKNYIDTFEKAHMLRFFLNSVVITLFTLLIGYIIFGMAAYSFARFRSKFSDSMFGLMSVALVIPSTATIVPTYILLKSIGLYDSKQALVFIYVALALPLSLFILRSFFLTIPKEIEESAYLDGAGFARTYFQIMLPIARPGFATAGVMAFLTAWNDFMYAYIMTTGVENRTVPLTMKFFQSQQFGNNLGPIFAATVIIVLPSIIVYLMMQNQIEAGLTSGAVKG